jgi:hypothetical protein
MCLFKEHVRSAVLIFNLIFVVIGAALIAIGTLQKNALEEVAPAIPPSYNFRLISLLTITNGSLIILVAFIGFLAVLHNNHPFLNIFGFVVLLVVLFQVTFGIFVFLEVQDSSDLSQKVNATVDDVFRENGNGMCVNILQGTLSCCGTYGPSFWNQTINKPFPLTCCKDDSCTRMYEEGCQDAFFEFLTDACRIVAVTVILYSAVEVVGAVLAFNLANHVKNLSVRDLDYFKL